MEPLQPQQQLPPPPPTPELLTSIIRVINDFQRKNTTMINYYIYPSPVPTEIAAYEPRLLIYRTRIQNLAKLSLTHVSSLVDEGHALILSYVRPSVMALAAASLGIQKIFIEHYDRGLEKSLPYETIFQTFNLYELNVRQLSQQLANNPRLRAAEYSVPPPSSTHPSLCRGAVAFLNNRDSGKVSNCPDTDLLPYHRSRLADRSGVVLWWECPVCAFKIRYHASNSSLLSINQTDEILLEDHINSIAYRPAWLIKCHIYHPRQQPKPPAPSPPTSPRQRYPPDPVSPTSPFRPNNASSSRPQPPPKRVSFMRRTSLSHTPATIVTETTTTRVRNVSPPRDYFYGHAHSPHSPQSPNAGASSKPKRPKSPTGPNNLRYFCPFCIAQGKAMIGAPDGSDSSSSSSGGNNDPEPTCFEDSRELIEHIEDRHTRDLPVNLLLWKLKVAVRGEMAPEPQGTGGRWDLDLR